MGEAVDPQSSSGLGTNAIGDEERDELQKVRTAATQEEDEEEVVVAPVDVAVAVDEEKTAPRCLVARAI